MKIIEKSALNLKISDLVIKSGVHRDDYELPLSYLQILVFFPNIHLQRHLFLGNVAILDPPCLAPCAIRSLGGRYEALTYKKCGRNRHQLTHLPSALKMTDLA